MVIAPHIQDEAVFGSDVIRDWHGRSLTHSRHTYLPIWVVDMVLSISQSAWVNEGGAQAEEDGAPLSFGDFVAATQGGLAGLVFLVVLIVFLVRLSGLPTWAVIAIAVALLVGALAVLSVRWVEQRRRQVAEWEARPPLPGGHPDT